MTLKMFLVLEDKLCNPDLIEGYGGGYGYGGYGGYGAGYGGYGRYVATARTLEAIDKNGDGKIDQEELNEAVDNGILPRYGYPYGDEDDIRERLAYDFKLANELAGGLSDSHKRYILAEAKTSTQKARKQYGEAAKRAFPGIRPDLYAGMGHPRFSAPGYPRFSAPGYDFPGMNPRPVSLIKANQIWESSSRKEVDMSMYEPQDRVSKAYAMEGKVAPRSEAEQTSWLGAGRSKLGSFTVKPN